jgi:WD40 repeat protein
MTNKNPFDYPRPLMKIKTFAFIRKFKTALPLITVLLCLTTLTAFSQKPELIVRQGHAIVVNSVAFSPNGKILASGSWDGTIRLWDVETGTELRTFKFEKTMVLSVAFSPDGSILACSGVGGVYLWDVATGRSLNEFKGGFVYSVAFSPNGSVLAIEDVSEKTITLRDVFTGLEMRKISNPNEKWSFVAFSQDGRSLASGSQGNTVKLWDAASGAEIRTFHGRSSNESAMVQPIALSLDGKMVASSDPDGTVHVWNVETGEEVSVIQNPALTVWSIAFSPDGKSIATGSEKTKDTKSNSNPTKLRNTTTGKELNPLDDPHKGDISVAFSPDGSLVAGGSRSGGVHIWDVGTGKIVRLLTGNSSPVTSTIFTPDRTSLVSINGNKIKTWNLADDRDPQTFLVDGNFDAFGGVAVSSNGKMAAKSNKNKTVSVLDIASGAKMHTLQLDQQTTSLIAFSPNNKLLATISSPDPQALMQMEMQPGGLPPSAIPTKTTIDI